MTMTLSGDRHTNNLLACVRINYAAQESTNTLTGCRMDVTQISGVAGGGKTGYQIDCIAGLIRSGYSPHEIGASTFTREGRRTMVHRTASAFGIDPTWLSDVGWFRTIHSTARRCLGVNGRQLLTDSPDAAKWLSDVFGTEVTTTTATDAETGFPVAVGSTNLIDDALGWWSYVRNTLASPMACIGRWPALADIGFSRAWQLVEKYELRKRLDGKADFADLLLRFVGVRLERSGLERVKPEGPLPRVRAWFFDEYQDSSPLVHLVAQRLVSASSVEQVYVAGDPYQSLYGFCGGTPKYLLDNTYWRFTHIKRLHHTHRCPREVMRISEDTLRGCGDYVDRGVTCRDDDGDVRSVTVNAEQLADLVDPQLGKWLVLARTNAQAMRIGRALSEHGTPWATTKGGSYLSEQRRIAAAAMLELRAHQRISPGAWRAILRTVDRHGIYTPAKLRALDAQIPLPDPLTRGDIVQHGASEQFLPWLDSIDFRHTSLPHKRYLDAVERHGHDEAMNPTIRLGTIHSVKGDEADNVLLYDAISQRAQHNLRSRGGDEERRVWYVGITRAKQRLLFCRKTSDRRALFR